MSAPTNPDDLLAEALALGRDEQARSKAILRQLSDLAPCDAWAGARLELADRAFGEDADYEVALSLARSVLESHREEVSEVPRAIAGVMMASAQEMLDRPIDQRMLRDSAEHCAILGQKYWAATGLKLLALRQLATGEQAAARRDLERAADLYDAAGSMLGSSGVLEKLARMAIDDGRLDDARALLDRGITYLRGFPYGGFQVRKLESKLTSLRESLENKTSES